MSDAVASSSWSERVAQKLRGFGLAAADVLPVRTSYGSGARSVASVWTRP
jgi:hypothetical protein